MDTTCELGVLSSEQRFNPIVTGTGEAQAQICFAHKLFQEYLGGVYLSSLYIVDQPLFWRTIKEDIIGNYQKFRYLLYFTAAHGKDPGFAGRPLMQHICKAIHEQEFLVDVAFECHDEQAISPIVKHFQENCTHLALSTRVQVLHKHTWSGW